MSSSHLTIIPLNRPLLNQVYPGGLGHAVRGIAATKDGKLMAIAGILYSPTIQAFSNIVDDEIRKHPRFIIRMARKLGEMIGTIEAPVYAIANSEEANSRRFLKTVGFEYVHETSRGALYQWPTP